MHKRFFSLALVFALILASVSGCAAPQPAPSGGASAPAATPAQSAPAPQVEAPYTYADTIAWDGAYDVIVIGFGGAGAVSASYAARAGAKVLLTEKAPEGGEGGNTKVCGQLVVTINDKEKGREYYKALIGDRYLPDAILETFLDGISRMTETLKNDYNVQTVYSGRENPIVAPSIPEFPELPGNEAIDLVTVTPEIQNAALWKVMREDVISRSDNIDVWFEAPGKHLIQDPFSKAIIGVQIEKQGELVNIRANNGVVLATGGFENNAEMRETYIGLPRMAVAGTLYNTGDGIRMAQEVGADLWHMDVWEGVGGYGGASFVVPETEHAALLIRPSNYNNGSLMVVDQSGTRYLDENFWPRHGHVAVAGSWHNPIFPTKSYLVYDANQKAKFDETGAIFEQFQNQVVSADTVEALAEKIGTPNLAQQVKYFNEFTKTGVDLQLGRAAASMVAFDKGPYYAIELMPLMLNTQGGPRRNENAEVVGIDGNPIPNLYSAGECGGITANLYQGGGNMSECIVFGQIAGTNAAAQKPALPAISPKVESDLVYVPGYKDEAANTDMQVGENEYLGVGSGGMGGDITVKITMDGAKISHIEVVKQSETEGIGSRAFEEMLPKMLETQSADVDGVSGATMTSKAFIAAVKDALSKVK